MWVEARKQERQIRTSMVDYKKRAQRRREYYQRIKQDPIKFMRITGRQSKIYLDSDVFYAAENSHVMLKWQGNPEVLIDRFDVRANLDASAADSSGRTAAKKLRLSRDERNEERCCNYERYRVLVQNDHASLSEFAALRQIEAEEKFGLDDLKKEDEKKKCEPKAAIGYTYSDSSSFTHAQATDAGNDSNSDMDISDDDIDVDIEPEKLTPDQVRGVLTVSHKYGMEKSDFLKLLRLDKELEESERLAKAEEEERAQMSGKKSRRERRMFKEQRLKQRSQLRPLRFEIDDVHAADNLQRGAYALPRLSPGKSLSSASDNEDGDADPLVPSTSASAAVVPPPSSVPIDIPVQHGPQLPPRLQAAAASAAASRRRRRSRGRSSSSSSSSSSTSASSASSRSRGGRRHPRRRSRERRKAASASASKTPAAAPSGYTKADFCNTFTQLPAGAQLQQSQPQPPPSAQRKRYYRRELEDRSSASDDGGGSGAARRHRRSSSSSGSDSAGASDSSLSADAGNSRTGPSGSKASAGAAAAAAAAAPRLTPQQLLQQRLSVAISKTYRADKQAEYAKQRRAREEQNLRDREIRRQTEEFRRRRVQQQKQQEPPAASSDEVEAAASNSASRRRSQRSRSRSRDRRRSRSRSRSHGRSRGGGGESRRRSRDRGRRGRNRSRSRSRSHGGGGASRQCSRTTLPKLVDY